MGQPPPQQSGKHLPMGGPGTKRPKEKIVWSASGYFFLARVSIILSPPPPSWMTLDSSFFGLTHTEDQ